MAEHGAVVKHDDDGTRVELRCPHQSGVLYAVPGEASWVCSAELRHAHALAGFLTELSRLQDPRVYRLMQRWGLYFRERPVEAAEEAPGSR